MKPVVRVLFFHLDIFFLMTIMHIFIPILICSAKTNLILITVIKKDVLFVRYSYTTVQK